MAHTWSAPTSRNFWVRNRTRSRVTTRALAGPLRICIVTETLHAGVGRHIVDAASVLAARGHEIHVVYSPLRMDADFLASLQSQAGIACHAVEMPHAIGASDLGAFLQIKNYIKESGPFDIIHGESSKAGGYARLLKLFGARTVVYSPHAFITFSPIISLKKRIVYQGIEALLSFLTDRIICSSQAEREHGQGLGISAKRLFVVPNGSKSRASQSREEMRARLGLRDDDVAIGYVGRMEDQKAPERLIDAVIPVLSESPRIHALLVGDGPKRPALEKKTRELGLLNQVHWLGAVNGQQVMAAMDVFALPSLYEGFAYVLLEALNAGLPIVSTPVGGTLESVLPDVNGFVVPHNDPAAFENALRRLARDADLRSKMGRASLEHAAHFTIERMAETIENVYFSALSSRKRVAEAALQPALPASQQTI